MIEMRDRAAQGDLLIRRVAALPGGLEREQPTAGRLVVAHSETGHHHWLPTDAEVWRAPGNPMVCYLRCDAPVALTHDRPWDQHEAIEIPAGIYELRRQREYTPQGWRRVED